MQRQGNLDGVWLFQYFQVNPLSWAIGLLDKEFPSHSCLAHSISASFRSDVLVGHPNGLPWTFVVNNVIKQGTAKSIRVRLHKNIWCYRRCMIQMLSPLKHQHEFIKQLVTSDGRCSSGRSWKSWTRTLAVAVENSSRGTRATRSSPHSFRVCEPFCTEFAKVSRFPTKVDSV